MRFSIHPKNHPSMQLRAVSVYNDKRDERYTYRGTCHAHSTESDGIALWRISLPQAALTDWPDDLSGWELVATDQDDDHYGDEIQRDTTRRGKRMLRIPRDDGGTSYAQIPTPMFP